MSNILYQIETEKVFIIGAVVVVCCLICSILYFNLEQNKAFSKGYEECYVELNGNRKTIMVKDCAKVLEKYNEIKKSEK